MRTRIDFQISAFYKKPLKWIIYECTFCGYPCGYVFWNEHENVGFDSGCDCIPHSNIIPCSWNKLAEYYNRQTNKKCIDEMDKFWGWLT